MGTCNCSFFYTNVHAGDATGGAIANAGSFQAVNLSLEGNTALGGLSSSTNGNSYGNSIANTGGVFQIVNSILSDGSSNNCFGTITDLGHNISSDATPTWTSGTSLSNTNPLLLPLANNGGPTLTMALGVGSPALNNGDCVLAPPTDQRGYPRPSGPGCDIGAWEGAGGPVTLRILRESVSTNVITWATDIGTTYRVEGATALNAWSVLASNLPGTGGTAQFRATNAGIRFIRVGAEP